MQPNYHLQKGKKLTLSTIESNLIRTINGSLKKYDSDLFRKMQQLDKEGYVHEIAQSLKGLNDALYHKRPVFAVCKKQPRNLDSGSHYYSIYYITKSGELDKVWLYDFIKYVGGKISSDRSLPKFVFYSGAIGMNRLLDATDGLFSYLRSIGGCYTQIDVI